MTVHDYVLRQLQQYNKIKQDVAALRFDLEALPASDADGEESLIESMTFAHHLDEAVQNNRIGDKTASIALNYHSVGLQEIAETRRQILAQLKHYELQLGRLDAYLAALPPEEAKVLRMHYFEGQSWQSIADAGQNCPRTVVKRRDQAMRRLEEFYGRLAAWGGLPDFNLDASQGAQI